MNDNQPAQWDIDLANNLASCGNVLIRFTASEDRRLNIAFVRDAQCSLEEQCLIAGEATAAIRSKLRGGR